MDGGGERRKRRKRMERMEKMEGIQGEAKIAWGAGCCCYC